MDLECLDKKEVGIALELVVEGLRVFRQGKDGYDFWIGY